MNLLSELNTLLSDCGIPVETGIFSDKAPDAYLVITPLSDSFELHADNRPGMDVQEARLSLYSMRITPRSMTYRRPGCPISTRGATPNRKMR